MEESGYLASVQQAIDFIESHLNEDISIEAVANHAGFSGFHFHRVFSSIVGESVAAYHRKRRLSEAARQLRTTKRGILDIACESGFESQAAFSRAFKKMFGCTPGSYRNGCISPMEKVQVTLSMIRHLQGGLTMEPRFVEIKEQSVIGIGSGFPPDSTEAIGKLWDNFIARAEEIQNVVRGQSFGICMAEHPEISKGDKDAFVYVCALPVCQNKEVPKGMVACHIPGGNYAVFTHKGSIAELPHTVKYIWGTWLPQHRDLYRETPDFELYDERFDPVTLSGEVDIYIPVR